MNFTPTAPALFFAVFAALAILCAILVVFKKSPVTSAFNLVFVFFCFAGIYALMGAHLLATLQILVYAGAIMVLFIFVIMLLHTKDQAVEEKEIKKSIVGLAAVAAIIGLGFMVFVFKTSSFFPNRGPFTREAIAQAGGNTKVISEVLFSEQLLPFELTSVLLLGAIIASVAIGMRRTAK